MKKFFIKLKNGLFGTKKRRILTLTSAVAVILSLAIVFGTVALVDYFKGEPTPDSDVSTPSREQSDNTNGGTEGESGYSGQIPQDGGNTGLEDVKQEILPDTTFAVLSRDEVNKSYRAYTDWRIYSIRAAKSEEKPKNGGRAIYVSNSGSPSNTGLSPDQALASPANLSRMVLRQGDVVYFERGSVWRTPFIAGVEGVTYSVYGEGEKPKFYASPDNFANTDYWESTDKANIYKCSVKLSEDVGTIVFNDGEAHGIKHIIVTDKNGIKVDNASKEPFAGYADLKQNYDFYHDNSSGYVYLYFDKGNPADSFESIELCIKKHIISIRANNITIDNLCLKYGGAHGISSGSVVGLTVKNCEFGWIGGSIQSGDYSSPTRFGNAVEVWGSANEFTVDNCYFYQIYDAAATFQYKSDDRHTIRYDNIKFNNNVMDYCNYSIEYFLSAGKTWDDCIKDIEFSGNMMWYAGEGFCAQRPEKTGAHIKSWKHVNDTQGSFVIKDNLFAFAYDMLLESYSKNGFEPEYSNNTYIQFEDKPLGRTGNMASTVKLSEGTLQRHFKDTTPKIIVVK